MATARPVSFSELLRRHRRAAGISQEALAQRAGLSRRASSDLERLHPSPALGHRRAPSRGAGPDRLVRSLFLTAAATSHQHGASQPPTATAAGATPPWHQAALTPLVKRCEELAQLEHQLQGRGPPMLLLAAGAGHWQDSAPAANRTACPFAPPGTRVPPSHLPCTPLRFPLGFGSSAP
jgi:hypothetical protein